MRSGSVSHDALRMDDRKWTPLVPWPAEVTAPVPIDPTGANGPTAGQARGDRWQRTSHGLFVPAGVDREIVEQRIVEHAARLPEGGAVTGWAALRLAGGRYFDGLAADGKTRLPVQLIVPAGSRLRPQGGCVHTRREVAGQKIRCLRGLKVVSPLQAVVDEVRQTDDAREATVVIDMALAAGFVTFTQLDRWIASSAGHRSVSVVRRARALAVERSMSPMETRMRLVWLLDAGLPPPLCNWPVNRVDGGYLGRPDLLDPVTGLFGEYDGRDHREREQHRRDVGRQEAFERAGLRGFTVVAGDLDDREMVVDRMRTAYGRAQEARVRGWVHAARARPLWRR